MGLLINYEKFGSRILDDLPEVWIKYPEFWNQIFVKEQILLHKKIKALKKQLPSSNNKQTLIK